MQAATLMKQKYMSPPIDHHQQHPMYSNPPTTGGTSLHNNAGNKRIKV